MSSDSNNTQTRNNTTDVENAKLIWDEYQYRHEHCWKLIFQITAAVVALSIIPYTNVDIAKSLTYWMVGLPVLGITLTLFSMIRLRKELDLLHKIRIRHRQWQNDLQGINYEGRRSTFSRDVMLYFGALVLINAIAIVALVFVWIPGLK